MNTTGVIAGRPNLDTGNVLPLLHEIRHALRRLADGGDGTIIDLQSLPLAPGEEKRIEKALGRGEVAIEIDALGPSSIQETVYPGVWLVTHRNTDEEVVARFIEVARIPQLAAAQAADIRTGLDELEETLAGNP
jgi:hydrogenase-1 operon protein HyaF